MPNGVRVQVSSSAPISGGGRRPGGAHAVVAQLVERNLAKVEVASPSLVYRSTSGSAPLRSPPGQAPQPHSTPQSLLFLQNLRVLSGGGRGNGAGMSGRSGCYDGKRRAGPGRPPRGCSSMAELQPSKLVTWVRFPSPAPTSECPSFRFRRASAPEASIPGFLLFGEKPFFRRETGTGIRETKQVWTPSPYLRH